MALLFNKPAAYLLAALAALALLWGVYTYIDHQSYQRAAVEYQARYDALVTEYANIARLEQDRQVKANAAAKQREAARIAEIQKENDLLQEQIKELADEADKDDRAGVPVLGASSVRRINAIR